MTVPAAPPRRFRSQARQAKLSGRNERNPECEHENPPATVHPPPIRATGEAHGGNQEQMLAAAARSPGPADISSEDRHEGKPTRRARHPNRPGGGEPANPSQSRGQPQDAAARRPPSGARRTRDPFCPRPEPPASFALRARPVRAVRPHRPATAHLRPRRHGYRDN